MIAFIIVTDLFRTLPGFADTQLGMVWLNLPSLPVLS